MTNLTDYIEVVETAYETMLAYAAQGRETDAAQGRETDAAQGRETDAAQGRETDHFAEPSADTVPSEIRILLTGLKEALQHIQELLSDSDFRFAEVVVDDIHKVDAALELVLAQTDLGSEIIDNLNASIHLRAVLTDLFLVDEAEI